MRHIPNWVINTVGGCIVAGNSVEQYAALSYVWNPPLIANVVIHSQPYEPLVFNSKNLDDFRKPGFLSSFGAAFVKLPLVIQHAIGLVAKSTVR